ncbi:MAG: COX15/CtaA family protein [Candidatus Promineifilaceae bacterium]
MLDWKQGGRFGRFTVINLIANILVIIWGGFVSASGAGDGCGASWPLCADAAVREASQLETFIELFHRATSGIVLIMALVMLLWARRLFPAGDRVRWAATGSMIFMLGEAAIGAFIVIFRLVAESESLARAFTQPLHLVNTYLLLAFLGITVLYAHGQPQIEKNQRFTRLLLVGLLGLLLLSAFGTLASLASTIFPSDTFIEGVRKDFSAEAHYLIRLRIWHPIIATTVGVYLLWLVKQVPQAAFVGTAALGLFALQYAFGILNAVLLTPIWLQLTHLLLSDLIWLAMIWFSAIALAPASRRQPLTPTFATD